MGDIFEELDAIGAESEDALDRFMNDEEMYLKYVKVFPEEPSMERLGKAVETKDYKAAEAAVHAMKGIVNNLGFLPLADAAVDMLAELREDNIADALDAYEDVKREYNRFCEIIIAWRDKQ